MGVKSLSHLRNEKGEKTELRPPDFFDLTAEEYNHPFHEGFYRHVAAELVTRIPAGMQADAILEVGAGTGFTTCLLGKRFPQSRIVALEPSIEMARRGKDKVLGAEWINQSLEDFDDRGYRQHFVAFNGGKVFNAPKHDFRMSGNFDLIVSSMSYHWLSDVERQKLMKLAAGGVLALALPMTGGPGFKGNELLTSLARKINLQPRWPHPARRPAAMRIFLKKYFSQVSYGQLNIHEEFENAGELARCLYDRGVLFALFTDGAEKAKEVLATQGMRNVDFNWTIGFFIASGVRGSLPR